MTTHSDPPPTEVVVRNLSFGSVAERYERFRPGYPRDLADTVIDYAGGPVRAALEVGAGTGKATRQFASWGIAVTAIEPDRQMARLLESSTRELPVNCVESTLEAFESTSRFDLVYSAAAWHWTDPAIRWARACDLLKPGGVLAVFGRQVEPVDPDLVAAISDIEKQMLSSDDPAVVHPWSIEEMAAVDGLVECRQHDLPSTTTVTASDLVGLLSTVSAYLMLTDAARAEALRQVRAVLPEHVDVDTSVQLSMARRNT